MESRSPFVILDGVHQPTECEVLAELSLVELRSVRDRLRCEDAVVSWHYRTVRADLERATAELVRRYRARPQDCLSVLALAGGSSAEA